MEPQGYASNCCFEERLLTRVACAEDKFAIGCSAKYISVCHFDSKQNWWVSKQIRKHSSAVLSVAWHPNNVLLATGCADYRARVISAAVRNVDKRCVCDAEMFVLNLTAPSRTGLETPWGDKISFGEVLAEFPTRGWVHDVDWAPTGHQLAFTCASP
jgi:actin related protein 2/3 complex subunit 1A/1B